MSGMMPIKLSMPVVWKREGKTKEKSVPVIQFKKKKKKTLEKPVEIS